jgi:hypothetical protein
MIIITGMQKSGTTAIAKLLGSSINQEACSDPFYRLFEKKGVDPRPDLYSGSISLKALWKKQQHFFTGSIIKDPDFVLMLPEVRALFPKAKIVFVIRDPRETIRSILNRLDLPGNPTNTDLKLQNIPAAWRDYISGENPDIPGSNYIEILARRWVMTAEAYLQNQEHCIAIKYENFKTNKIASIHELANQLGYKDFHSIDQLIDIQYQPKGNTDMSWVDFFGQEQLATIHEITKPMLEQLDYTTHEPNT